MKCLFRHRYTPIVAQQGHLIKTDFFGDIGRSSAATIVTLRCQRCGKLKQRKLIGHLTLEDIIGGK